MRDNDRGMGGLGDKTAAEVDAELKDEELKVLASTAVDWETLRPQINDPKKYDELMAVVKDSTANNESVVRLRQRIAGLGKGAISVAKKVVELIR